MKVLFEMAGCEVIQESIQSDFPRELCAVHMIALVKKIDDVPEVAIFK